LHVVLATTNYLEEHDLRTSRGSYVLNSFIYRVRHTEDYILPLLETNPTETTEAYKARLGSTEAEGTMEATAQSRDLCIRYDLLSKMFRKRV